jgi:hypothetical protein
MNMFFLNVTILAAGFIALSVTRAHAYLDPGTGSLVFQALVAGVLGAFFSIKMYWHALKKKVQDLFQKDKTKSRADDDTTDQKH